MGQRAHSCLPAMVEVSPAGTSGFVFSQLRTPDAYCDSFDGGAMLPGGRQQRVGFITKPGGPGRGTTDYDQFAVLANVRGDQACGLVGGQCPGQRLGERTHVPGAPDDVT